MPPQNKEKALRIDATQAALPFNSPTYEKNESQNDIKNNETQRASPSSNQAEDNSNSVDNSVVRITTRARRTYELDRFSKNAMLIIDNKSHVSREHVNHNLDEAFQKYRFEVEKHVDLTKDEIVAACERFFQRDFTEYGAVAVAVMAKIDRNGHIVACCDSALEESVITSNFTVNLPTTLKGKPIIYITEVADFYLNRQEPMNYPDILKFHIPVSVVSSSHPLHHRQSTLRPLQILSYFLKEAGDSKSLLDIMTAAVNQIVNTWLFYKDYPIRICSSLTKELILVKS